MDRKKILIIAGFILLMAGCTDFVMICSLNPFYLKKDITLSPEIEGRWSATPLRSKSDSSQHNSTHWRVADTTSVWHIEQFVADKTVKTAKGNDSTYYEPANYYTVRLTGNDPDTSTFEFKMVLFRINDELYADFEPAGNPAFKMSRLTYENYFSVHTLARVTINEHYLKISWLGADYMKDMIENKHIRVSYKWVDSAQRLLLTGSSDQLTNMIKQYAGEKRFIDWDNQSAMLKLTRIN